MRNLKNSVFTLTFTALAPICFSVDHSYDNSVVECRDFFSRQRLITLSPTPKTFSYRDVEERIKNLQGFEVKIAGKIQDGSREYSIYALSSPEDITNLTRKNVFLSGGVHGDEPVGVFAILEFLENHAAKFHKDFRFFTVPAVNPTGLNRRTLENGNGDNVNRSFSTSITVNEAKIVANTLKEWNKKYSFTIDMHEIPWYWSAEGWSALDNPHHAYLYETQNDRRCRIGGQMIANLPDDIEVCAWTSIYGDQAYNGLVSYPDGNFNTTYLEGTTLEAYMSRLYSSHTFTSETPIHWPLEKRVRTHLSWLNSALEFYSERKQKVE